MITTDDLLWYIDEALDGMVEILTTLGDEQANRAPDLPAANCAYAVVTHCLGVMAYWGGEVIAGRVVDRDRPAEFRARGEVGALIGALRQARVQLEQDLRGMEPFAAPRGPVEGEDAVLPLGRTQGAAAVHIFEELAQHRGQLEITRDLLLVATLPEGG